MDAVHLEHALRLADKRRGFSAPNPSVGAVLMKDGKVLGEGTHWATGHPHAEVEALKDVGEEARGATLYITLEPCSHWGKTPPCTGLIQSRGIARVVFGFRDPNPKAARGMEELASAGIRCEHVPLPSIDAFYESYGHWTRTGRPLVTLKMALSLDGKIAGGAATRTLLTSHPLNAWTHECRRRADALLTTARTVAMDNPRLDARTPDGPHKKPVFVVDRTASVHSTAKIFRTAASVTLLHGESAPEAQVEALRARGARSVRLPEGPGGLSMEAVLAEVGGAGIHDLWVEAGSKMFQTLLGLPEVKRVLLYVAPRWLGNRGLPALGPEGNESLASFETHAWTAFGRDAVCEMRR